MGKIVSAACLSISTSSHTRAQETKGDVQYYHFTVVAGEHTHAFGQRFSEYYKIHKRLDSADCELPEFPSRRVFGGVDPKERSKELGQWLMGLLRSSSTSINPLFHSLFRFPAPMVEEIKRSVAARRQQRQSPARNASAPAPPAGGGAQQRNSSSGRLSAGTRFTFSQRDAVGQGGYGKTYLGRDSQNDNESVIVKEFTPQHGQGKLSDADKDMFRKEANQLQVSCCPFTNYVSRNVSALMVGVVGSC